MTQELCGSRVDTAMTIVWVESLSFPDRAADLRGGGLRVEVEVEVEGCKRWRWRQYEKLNGRARGGGREKVEGARWSGFVHGRFETSILLKI